MYLFSVITIILTPSTLNSSCHGGRKFISSGKASDPFPRLGAKTSKHTSLESTDLHRAQTSLKALYGLYLSRMELENNAMLPEPKSETSNLINICQGLKKDNPDEETLQALARNPTLEIHTQEMVVQFTDGAQEMLSLLARHFDPECTSIAIGLLRFLSCPYRQLHTVCEHIYPHYNFLETFQHFKEKLGRFLKLLPHLVLNGLEELHSEV